MRLPHRPFFFFWTVQSIRFVFISMKGYLPFIADSFENQQ